VCASPDALWHGADMFGTGVASFGHVNGVHLQNVDTWEQYIEKLDRDELPLGRALPVTPRERLIREMILQQPPKPAEMGKAILADVRRHAAGRAQNDDITLMVFGRIAE